MLWSCLAGVSVLMAFHVLHSLIDHTLAIIGAAFVGVIVGCLGYGWGGGQPSRGGIAIAGALGGGLGLFALHLLPLLH